jgi:hypothetical protein
MAMFFASLAVVNTILAVLNGAVGNHWTAVLCVTAAAFCTYGLASAQ